MLKCNEFTKFRAKQLTFFCYWIQGMAMVKKYQDRKTLVTFQLVKAKQFPNKIGKKKC